MYIPKLRTVPEVVQYIKSQDAETAVTESFIQKLIAKKKIIARRIGSKVLVSLDDCLLAIMRCWNE